MPASRSSLNILYSIHPKLFLYYMIMTIDIRKASNPDIEALVRLNDQIQRQHAEQYPDEFKYPIVSAQSRIFFQRALDSKDQHLMVADVDGLVMAYLWFERQVRPESDIRPAKTRFYVQHICVDADHQRSGIATALFQWLEERAQANNISEIALDTWALNESGQAFFAARGFAPSRLMLSKKLDAP